MSPGQKSVLMWAAIILFAAWLMGINVGSFITSVLHALQTVHNQNVH